MKILLIQPPNKEETMTGLYPKGYAGKARSIFPPLGLLSLASYLKERHDVVVLDMILLNQTVDDLARVLKDIKPDMVGVTAIIGLWSSVLKIFKKIKELDPSIYTVIGGPNATYFPEETFCHKEIDYLIVGNGQKPLMELCNRLEQGRPQEGIENCFKQGLVYSKFEVINTREYNLDKFPFPDRTFTPYMSYSVPFCPENPSTTMITSMGCPYKCVFCTTARPSLMILPAEKVVEELESIYKLGIKSVLFQDELFTTDKKRVREVCGSLIDKDIQLHWTMKSRIDGIQPWMPGLMKKAGCFNIHFGIESGNNDTLMRMKKGYTTDIIKETVNLVKEAGLSITGNFMLAYPGESEADILHTIDFAKELELNISQFSLTIDSPGSALFEEAVRIGRRSHNYLSEYVRHPDPDNSGLPTVLFSASDRFSEDELHSFLEKAYASTKTLFDLK
jgi:anaerobic magnesium-protoporphyrin IX monomethyl ester cyclase